MWGLVASRSGLNAAYFGIAAGFVFGAAMAVRLRVVTGEAADYSPAGHWPDPVVAGEPSLDAGPVMVQVEYRTDAASTEAFRAAVTELGKSRRRDGAIQWWLFQDTSDPSRFVETWIEETWGDHLRNHERVSFAHKALEERVRALTRSDTPITTRHFIAPDRAAYRAAADKDA